MNNEYLILKGESFSFSEYIKDIEETTDLHPMEKNYQLVVMKMLKELFANSNLRVVDCSDFKKSGTGVHNPQKYAGEKGQPDILITKTFYYSNIPNDESEILVTMEVKRPSYKIYQEPSGEMIFYKNVTENNRCKAQLMSHLSKINKVIVTDCITWAFYNADKDVRLPVKVIKLKDDNGEWKVGKKKIDMFTKELLALETEYIESEPEDWLKLKKYIKDFTLPGDR